MKIIVTKNHQESCRLTADAIIELINSKESVTLGLATGGTAEQVYDELVESYEQKKVSFSKVHTINLDEYVGLAPDHEQSYRYFMNKFLFNRVDIDKKNTFVPIGNDDHNHSLQEFQNHLANTPRDFQLLGIGPNGHIAFNEPDSKLHSDAHIIDIAESTIQANARYFESETDVPKKAFTQGMGDILKAKKIILLATGSNKATAIQSLIKDDIIDPQTPCTFLKLHTDVTVIIDQDLANLLNFNK